MQAVSGIHKIAVAGLAAISIGGLAFAHSGATGVVKQRMESMKAIAWSMKAISKLDWANPEKARASLQKNAEAIGGHASHIVKMFPEGSIKGPSEAIPAIWEEPDEFQRLANALKTRAADLAKLAPDVSSAAQIKSQMTGIGETCKTCHEVFRKKK